MRLSVLFLAFSLCASLAAAQKNSPAAGAVKTGQQTVYARHDDAWYARRGIGMPPKMQKNNDGTVTDLHSGLVWVADPSKCGGKFGSPEKPIQMTNTGAVQACENLIYAGHDDWRVPTVAELETLVDAGRVYSCVNTSLFACLPDLYWTSSSPPDSKKDQWTVDFAAGFARLISPTDRLMYVRPVRTDTSAPILERHRYVDNGNGTVTDDSTGLMWVRDPQTAGIEKRYPWSEAIDRCEKLEYAGYKDWRLPNRNESQSLLDYGRFDPCMNTAFFVVGYVERQDIKEEKVYWTSTTHAGSNRWAWAAGSMAGEIDSGDKAIPLFIRPVRTK